MHPAPSSYGQTAFVTVPSPRWIGFASRIADACRQIRRSAPPLSKPDSKLLNEFQEGRGLVRIARLADIASTCGDPADATVLGDVFRGHSLARRATMAFPTIIEAMRLEAPADGAEDAAVVEYLANPCEPNRQRAIEALRRVVERSQDLIDALHRRGPAA
jgi:hypothetical protein